VLTGDLEDLSESSNCLSCWSLPALRRLPWELPCSGRPVPSSPVLSVPSFPFADSAIFRLTVAYSSQEAPGTQGKMKMDLS
jgi:hypothetical protein